MSIHIWGHVTLYNVAALGGKTYKVLAFTWPQLDWCLPSLQRNSYFLFCMFKAGDLNCKCVTQLEKNKCHYCHYIMLRVYCQMYSCFKASNIIMFSRINKTLEGNIAFQSSFLWCISLFAIWLNLSQTSLFSHWQHKKTGT